jgi:hypothetical protein
MVYKPRILNLIYHSIQIELPKMSFAKVALFACLFLVVLQVCSAIPPSRESKMQAEQLADTMKSGFNTVYQMGRFLFHGPEKMRTAP